MAEKVFKIAAHGLLKKGNRYLVLLRSDTDGYMPGYWDLPGGAINFGEDTYAALRREFIEETGLKISIGQILLAYGYMSGQWRHQFQLVFSCINPKGKVRLSRDHTEYRWVTLKEMGKLKKIAYFSALYKHLVK